MTMSHDLAPPRALVEWLVDELRLEAASVVAVAAPDATVDALRERSPRIVEPDDPGEAVPRWLLADGAADAVVLAAASDRVHAPQALEEVLRVLAPHGRVGVVEVVLDTRFGLVRGLERMLDPRVEQGRSDRSKAWASAVEHDERFGRLTWQVFQHVEMLRPNEVAQRVVALPEVAELPHEDRLGLVEQLTRAAANESREDGYVEVPYRVDAAWAPRTEAAS